MYILANMWFTTLMRQFFFNIDKVVFNFISTIYDLLITIARTSVLSQADIADMAGRVYKLLAVFMIFKVILSLITYVVNPDDFSDKSKGVAKLGTNIIISLALLILTPYIFNYAYQLQTIILEDNSLATLIFGDSNKKDFFTTAGDDMAFMVMSPFFTPDTSIEALFDCTQLLVEDGNGNTKFNNKCSGLKEDLSDDTNVESDKSLLSLVDDKKGRFTKQTLKNYVAGVQTNTLSLMFRQDMAVATDPDNDFYIMDYKYLFSTAIGIVVILLLISFCMDVGVRSIKLAFLQLIAPVPILSYIDPKSGKDGLFKKWYEMCFKTFVSLFVRLLAIYFAVYIISRVAEMKLIDVITGAYVTNGFVAIFIIIGALMFAKQFPEILKALGIKLDGDGKFFLNPLKKFEEQAIGGKRITGAAGGAVAGLIGSKGNPFSAMAGAARGFNANKGFSGGMSRQADVNRKLRQARIQGASFLGSRLGLLSNKFGLDDADLEGEATRLRKDKRAIELKRRSVDDSVKEKQVRKKQIQDSISESKKEIAKQERMQGAVSKMEERAKTEIQNGNGGQIGKKYLTKKATAEYYENNIGKEIEIDGKKTTITPEMAASARLDANEYLTKQGMYEYMTAAANDENFDKTFSNSYKDYKAAAADIGLTTSTDGETIHGQYGKSKGEVSAIKRDIHPEETAISDIDDEIRKIEANETVKISGEDKEVTIEEAERIIKEREQKLKDKQDQRKLQRDYAKDSQIGGGS